MRVRIVLEGGLAGARAMLRPVDDGRDAGLGAGLSRAYAPALDGPIPCSPIRRS